MTKDSGHKSNQNILTFYLLASPSPVALLHPVNHSKQIYLLDRHPLNTVHMIDGYVKYPYRSASSLMPPQINSRSLKAGLHLRLLFHYSSADGVCQATSRQYRLSF